MYISLDLKETKVDRQERAMNNDVVAGNTVSSWRQAYIWVGDLLKAMDYSVHEDTSASINKLTEAISALEKRVVTLELSKK